MSPFVLAALGIPLLLVTGPASAHPSPASPPAPAAAPAAAPAGQPPAGGQHAVVLKDGTRIACVEAPLVALGRVLYRTADGVRHSLPADRVDLDQTRPTARALAQSRPRPDAPHAGQMPGMPPATAPASRRQAPDFSARRADGTELKLSDLKGKVVLLDFWATWCGPCVVEIPTLKRLHEKHAGPDFEIVGVSLDRSRAELDGFLKAHGLKWPQSFDGKAWENGVARQYGVQSIPQMLLLDRHGRIARAGVRGPLLAEAVADLIAEEPRGKAARPG